jgi:hypothetical protein
LGALLARSGESAAGRAMLEESLTVFRRLGEGVGVAVCSLLLGVTLPSGMLVEIGEDAVRMWGRLSLGCEMPHVDDGRGWRIVEDPS